MNSLVQSLTYTTQTVQNAQQTNDSIQLWVSAREKWERGAFDKKMTSYILEASEKNFERLSTLSETGFENTIYCFVGSSRQMLKIAMSLKYFFSNLQKAVDKQLAGFEVFKSLWTEDKSVGLKKFLDTNP